MEQVDYIDNINARNYLMDYKTLYEGLKPKKSSIVAAWILVIVSIALVIACVLKVTEVLDPIFTGAVVFILLCWAAMEFYTANMHKRFAASLIKDIEDDMNNANYETKRIIYGGSATERMVRMVDREVKSSPSIKTVPMYMYDARNKQRIYRFNGIKLEFVPIEYGTQLELTYLAKSKVINSITVTE